MYVRFLAQMMINTMMTMFIITEIASNTPSAITSTDLSSPTIFHSLIVRGVTLFQKVGVPIFGGVDGLARGWGLGMGAVPPPQKIFHYLLSKRRILVDT